MKILDVLKNQKVVSAVKGTALVTSIIGGVAGILSSIGGFEKAEQREDIEKAVEKYMSEKEKLEE